MPTKDELIAFASDVGVDVSSSATKAEIEASLYDAGYDPLTLEAIEMADEPTTTSEEVERTSSDASFSTYTRVDEQREGAEPPFPGPQTLQYRGVADESGGTTFSANR